MMITGKIVTNYKSKRNLPGQYVRNILSEDANLDRNVTQRLFKSIFFMGALQVMLMRTVMRDFLSQGRYE